MLFGVVVVLFPIAQSSLFGLWLVVILLLLHYAVDVCFFLVFFVRFVPIRWWQLHSRLSYILNGAEVWHSSRWEKGASVAFCAIIFRIRAMDSYLGHYLE